MSRRYFNILICKIFYIVPRVKNWMNCLQRAEFHLIRKDDTRRRNCRIPMDSADFFYLQRPAAACRGQLLLISSNVSWVNKIDLPFNKNSSINCFCSSFKYSLKQNASESNRSMLQHHNCPVYSNPFFLFLCFELQVLANRNSSGCYMPFYFTTSWLR